MSWSSQPSPSRATRPPDWRARRAACLARDGHLCRLRYPDVCIGHATIADHIRNVPDHNPHNLQAACAPCHTVKTEAEAAAARAARASAARRATPPPPGTRRPGMPARLP